MINPSGDKFATSKEEGRLGNKNENKMTAEDKINDDEWLEEGGGGGGGKVLRAGRGLNCQSTPVSLKKVCPARCTRFTSK